MPLKVLVFSILSATIMFADIRYDIFITSFKNTEDYKAVEYKKTLQEYLLLRNIKQRILIQNNKDKINIKVIGFTSLDETKKIKKLLENDFDEIFIQENTVDNLSEVHKKAVELLEKLQPKEAYELLYKAYNSNNYNNQTLFLLANSSKDNGDIKNAIRFYEELLSLDPSAHRVRLDLAKLYYQNRQFDKGDEQFLVVESSSIPIQVRRNIENFKLQRKQANQKNYEVSASLGYLYDSNVNVGPNSDTVTLYNIEFTLSDDAKKTSDNALTKKVNATLYNQFDSFLLKNSLDINTIDYNNLDDYDSTTLSYTFAPIFFRENDIYIVPISYTDTKLGMSEDYYLRDIAISPTLKKRVSSTFSHLFGVRMEKKDYQDIEDKNGYTYGVNYGVEIINSKESNINFNTYLNKNESKEDIYSYTNVGVNLSYSDILIPKVLFIGTFNSDISLYDEAEDAFDSKKDNYTFSGSVNFIYNLGFYNSNLIFSHFEQRNISNLDLYSYDRSQTTLAFSMKY